MKIILLKFLLCKIKGTTYLGRLKYDDTEIFLLYNKIMVYYPHCIGVDSTRLADRDVPVI